MSFFLALYLRSASIAQSLQDRLLSAATRVFSGVYGWPFLHESDRLLRIGGASLSRFLYSSRSALAHSLHDLCPALFVCVFSGVYSCPRRQCVSLADLAALFAAPSLDITLFANRSLNFTPLAIRFSSVECATPEISARSRSAILPSILVARVFRICSVRVAHLQFSGWYPSLLSTRSIEQPLGFTPISAANALKSLSQRSQTYMPLAP